jgi:hypothetical protein
MPPFCSVTLVGNPCANAVPQRKPNDKSDCDFEHWDAVLAPHTYVGRKRLPVTAHAHYRVAPSMKLPTWLCCVSS